MAPRQPLTARLEDLQSELEALRLFRRQRVITNARSFQRERARLLKAIEDVKADIAQEKRSREIAREIAERERKAKEKKEKAQRKRQFLNTLRRNFQSRQPFTVQFGNAFISDREILDVIARQTGRWSVNVGNQFYILNDNTRMRFRDLIENNLVVEEGASQSDEQWFTWVNQVGTIQIQPVQENQGYAFLNGAFFKWTNKTHYDFSRYGIYDEVVPENYTNNCLIHAFEMFGLEIQKLDTLKTFVKNRSIPKKDLKLIAEKLNMKIILKTSKLDGKDSESFSYGEGEEIHIGLIESHYFLIEKTNVTRFSLEHYDEIKELENSNFIYKKQGIYYKREQGRCIDSFDVVKILLKHKDTLLQEITRNDEQIASTQFYDKINSEIVSLEYDPSICCHLVENPMISFGLEETIEPKAHVSGKLIVLNKSMKEIEEIVYQNVFFDFETYVENSIHIPYLCCSVSDSGVKKTFIGSDCAYQLLNSLNGHTRLIAHNASYDYRFLLQHLHSLQEISKGNRLISASGKFKKWNIQIKDSLHLISKPLRDFSDMFNLENPKEVMFYNFYSLETIQKRLHNPSDVLPFVEERQQTQFMTNLEKWNLLNEDGTFDIIAYSAKYCQIDCQILREGYTIFRKWMNDLVNIDINEVLTIASLAHQYFINQGCYEDVYQLSGVPQMFIQQAVVGGRTMVSENKKIILDTAGTIINDFDAVSLYPSAMRRMDGFLKGVPKVLTELSYDFLKQQDGYFVDIRITNVGIHRKFPLMSFKNQDGVRIFTNDMVGKIICVDRYTLEDLIEFQNISFEVLRGYYFNDGFNTKINSVIKFLFDERLRLKNEKNPAQECYKLIMNSGYGKSIMKPVEYETKLFDNEDRFNTWLSRHYNWVVQYTKFGKKVKVKVVKTLDEHSNIAQVGTMILSMSKRIMNEVMCLAEDNALEMYYQDTDSIHILDKDIKILASLYKEKYGRELIGKSFNQFHSDFEIKGAKNIYARKSIFLAKKFYCDELVGVDSNGNEVIDYHIRMKGIPNKVIQYTCDKLGYCNPFEMYMDLAKGKAIDFDLTNDGSRANFKFHNDYSVSTLSYFVRRIQFT